MRTLTRTVDAKAVDAFARRIEDDIADRATTRHGDAEVIHVKRVPAGYAGLVGLVAGGRPVVGKARLHEALGQAQDALAASVAPPSGLLGKLGLVKKAQPSPKVRAIADELLAMMQLEAGARYAATVQLAIRYGQSGAKLT